MCTFGQVVAVTGHIHFSKSAYLVFTSSLHPDHQCCRRPPATERHTERTQCFLNGKIKYIYHYCFRGNIVLFTPLHLFDACAHII